MSAQDQLSLIQDNPAPITIGVDESGTGAWAGPFTVAAVALPSEGVELAGLTDSKVLSDDFRRRLVPIIREDSFCSVVKTVTLRQIRERGVKDAWRWAIAAAVTRLAATLQVRGHDRFRVVIDGNYDQYLGRMLGYLKLPCGADFVPKADRKVPAVSAASVLAKTTRNDMMIALDKVHPGFGWAKNAGYATKEHTEMVRMGGVTPFHRDFKVKVRAVPEDVSKTHRKEMSVSGSELNTTGAVMSDDRKYRYRLWRRWGNGPKVCWIMLNPSTADETDNDATIRRCINFAKSWGYEAIEVVNLFAWRATSPKDLKSAMAPIGSENDQHIYEAVRESDLIVCAWGSHGSFGGRYHAVVRDIESYGRELHCLGKTKGGHPKHPVRLSGDLQPQPM